MSAKFSLIFALAALCCLVVSTEAAAQRSRVLSSRRGSELVEKSSDSKEESALAAQEQEVQRQEQEQQRNDLEARSEDGAAATENKQDTANATATKDKDTVVRPNKNDARARRVVRAGRRRGGRRGGRRGRRGGRRGRRGGRRGGRRRGGRRGGARRRASVKRRSGKGKA